jgi:tetratricopeptide (TPR) repeat protein
MNISNEVNARTTGTVVQVGTVVGGVHVHDVLGGLSTIEPRQLPASPVLFTGRGADLARLTQALDETEAGTVVISAVGGAGGIGKTWLVLRWAHRHLERFPDGQLYVDLRGFSPDSEPMSSSVALRGFLCALGVEPATLPVDEHARAALFRTLVSGKRMLIVLDNAAETEQVTPLLPGSPTCAVLVTSRRRLTGLVNAHGARHVALDVLPDDDARALLAARVGATRMAGDRQAVDQLVIACNGFPLALSIVAGRIAAHPHLPLSTMVEELRDAGLDGLDDGDTASVPAVLSWSYRALTRKQATVFTLLGIAPGPDISLAAAASLTGMPTPETRIVLRDLEQASLLIQHAPERYRMHDLTRVCARSHADRDLTDAERRSALHRVVDFYLHTAHNAHLVLEPYDFYVGLHPPVPSCRPLRLTNHAKALAWFTNEHSCLLAAQASAMLTGFLDAQWQLAWALTGYHHLRGFLREDYQTWINGETAAAYGNPAVLALVHWHIGNAHLRMGDIDQARGRLGHAVALAEAANDLGIQARIHRTMSVMYEHDGNNQLAMEHATRALELFQAVGDRIWVADTLNTVGWCAALLGRYNEALECCHAAFPVLREHHRPGAADVLDTLGYAAHHTGQNTAALNYLRRALALYRDLGDLFHVPDTLDRVGHVLVTLDRTDEARATWQEALALYRAQQRLADARRVQKQLDTPKPPVIAGSWPYRRR